eukprot:403343273
MIVNKSDQIHQPLLSDTPIQNTNSSNIDQGDNSQGLPQQEELSLTKKSQQLEIFQSSKDIYDFDINSEKEFQPVNCLLEPQNQTEVLIQINKAKTLQNPVDQEYVVFFVGFEFDINGSQVTSDLQNPSSLIWDLNEITKKYKF